MVWLEARARLAGTLDPIQSLSLLDGRTLRFRFNFVSKFSDPFPQVQRIVTASAR